VLLKLFQRLSLDEPETAGRREAKVTVTKWERGETARRSVAVAFDKEARGAVGCGWAKVRLESMCSRESPQLLVLPVKAQQQAGQVQVLNVVTTQACCK